uniref:SAP domain-containing protein n=1 Tax=Neogobius melanostomus TaxID=47308 RepID=A0A8C6SIY9_9GOBI
PTLGTTGLHHLVAELKAELKLRGLTVSGTKNDLIERLRNYQEQNGSTAQTHMRASQTAESYQGFRDSAAHTSERRRAESKKGRAGGEDGGRDAS